MTTTPIRPAAEPVRPVSPADYHAHARGWVARRRAARRAVDELYADADRWLGPSRLDRMDRGVLVGAA